MSLSMETFPLDDLGIQIHREVPVRKTSLADLQIFSPENSSMVVQLNHRGERISATRGFVIRVEIPGSAELLTVVVDYEYPGLAAYTSAYDVLFLGREARTLLAHSPQVAPVLLGHELSHRRYFWLQKTEQINLADLFLTNDVLRAYLYQFAIARYQEFFQETDYGARALGSDSITNEKQDIVLGTDPGMKDTRSVLVPAMNAGELTDCRVFLFSLVSELMAYGHIHLLNTVTLQQYRRFERARRHTDSLPDHIMIASQAIEYIFGNELLRKRFEAFGIYADIHSGFVYNTDWIASHRAYWS